ncbi:hypothetical protein ACTOB_001400 [Actinoplanes oblitus]|uniref:Uncharacterized protein n=1 Tax=Actinoplanes oblitus TaxID=3040509 RepID=A0ABY8WLE9_9ACTN|nr:hypothetical protein [Actinoplanes oblitus]WIM97846.1 hypothetical protein ACTOB_001400 [Actinoplanes oblitus]
MATNNPANILAVRALLMKPLGLSAVELGIKGNVAHVKSGSSYHLGIGDLRSDSYSLIESSRDGRYATDDAAALDIGYFNITVRGKRHTLRTFNAWMVRQLEAGTDDTRDIREFIYSTDGETVHRWDRLKRRTTGDLSHTGHSHVSWFRDAIKGGRDLTAVFRRYLTEIGLLEDDMPSIDEIRKVMRDELHGWTEEDPDSTKNPKGQGRVGGWIRMFEQRARNRHAQLLAAITGKDVDEQAVAAAVLAGLTPARLGAAITAAGLTPQTLAAAIPAGLASEVVNELRDRLAA